MSQPYDTPLWGDPDPPKPQRPLTAKEQDDAVNRIVWTRHKVSGVGCCDCITERREQPASRPPIAAATWLRVQGQDKAAVCYRHKAEWQFRDDRGGA